MEPLKIRDEPGSRSQPTNSFGAPVSTSVGAGALGAFVATICCIPSAAAAAIGLSLGTAVTLGNLLAYRPWFVAAGLGVSGAVLWLGLRRGRTVRPSVSHARGRQPPR